MSVLASRGRSLLPLQIAMGVILTYLVTAHTLASYLAQKSPEAALRLNANEPVALTKLAERELPNLLVSPDNPKPSDAPSEAPGEDTSRLEGFARLPKLDLKADPSSTATPPAEAHELSRELQQSIAGWLERSIIANPLNAQGLSLLGGLSVGAGEDARADTLMQAAIARTARAPLASYWLMRSNFEAKRYPEALAQADKLLRSTPLNAPIAAPYLGRIAEAAPEAMAEQLAINPPWRGLFFLYLKGNIKDPRTPLNLLLKLKETATPPTALEFGPYVALLMENGFVELAYAAWLQSLSPEQLTRAGFIYNGGFDYAPAKYPFPFEWSITPAKGVLLDLIKMQDGNNALIMKFGPGRTDFRPVAQTTMLMPGDYTLTARYRGSIQARRGLRWTIDCAGKSPRKLAEGEAVNGSIPDWKVVSLSFSVPPDSCRSQQVKFTLDARSASETLVSGTLFLDDVAIVRQGEKGN